MRLGQLFLDLAIVIDAALLCVDEQDLSGLQTPFAHYIARFEVHHTHFTGHDHHATLGDGVATGTQTVAIEHAACITTIAEEQCGGTVPRLHQYRVVFVERLQIARYGVLVVEALRHEDGHGLCQGQSAHRQEFEHVVETGRVAHAFLHDGSQVADVAQSLTVEHTLTCLHPTAIAANGVDLAIMRQKTEGLSQRPGGEGIGAES